MIRRRQKMSYMSKEEADYWDEFYTANVPKIDFSRPGLIPQNKSMCVVLDDYSKDYIYSKMHMTEKDPEDIILDIIIKKIFSE
jgi:hypothetical protein